ncbi:MAG: PHP domain-containing protein [Dehalococcoidia bacterium]|nr:MAG: PHP domain-containing protein [Dehalococcoidia bacterium]
MIIDLHTHTWPYSDDSDLKPRELIERAKSFSLDGICFTEHDWHWKEEDIAKLCGEYDFPIFQGMEISSEEGHLLVFGLTEYKFGMHHAHFIRQLVDEVGGVIIMAHPYRARVRYNTDPAQLLDSICYNRIFDLVDAIEVMNGRSKDNENKFALDIGYRLNLRGVGGSDAHAPSEIPTFATEFEREIGSVEELIAELKAGRFRAVDLR